MKFKTFLAVMAVVVAVMAVAACATGSSEEVKTDSFTSASTSSSYEDYALKGDELMDAINSVSGFYLLTTTNPDGTPQAGFYIYGCVKQGDDYYIQLGLAENQGRQNFANNQKAVAVYAAAPSDQPFAMSGAKMELELVTDDDLLTELGADPNGVMQFGKVVAVYPLG